MMVVLPVLERCYELRVILVARVQVLVSFILPWWYLPYKHLPSPYPPPLRMHVHGEMMFSFFQTWKNERKLSIPSFRPCTFLPPWMYWTTSWRQYCSCLSVVNNVLQAQECSFKYPFHCNTRKCKGHAFLIRYYPFISRKKEVLYFSIVPVGALNAVFVTEYTLGWEIANLL